MASIVAKFLYWIGRSPIGQALFTLLVEKLATFISQSIAREKHRRKIIVDAQNSVQALKDAETQKQIDDATPGALNKF